MKLNIPKIIDSEIDPESEEEKLYQFNLSMDIQFGPVWCSITTDMPPELEGSIYKKLSFYAENYFFSPKFQRNQWDGMYHLYHPKTKSFRVGLLNRVINIMEKHGCIVHVLDKPSATEFVQRSNSYNLRPYQLSAVKDCLSKRFGILQAPPRAGKTEVFVAIVDSERAFPVVFFCRSLDLAYQTKARVEKYLPDISVGIVGDGEVDIKDVTIITIQSAFFALNAKIKEKDLYIERLPDKFKKLKIEIFIKKAKIVVYDECFPAKTLVHLDENTMVPIKSIYNNLSITHVLSYNEKMDRLEKRKIIRRTKRIVPTEELVEIGTYIGKFKKKYRVRCTDSHKFWVKDRGYIKAKDLSLNETVKVLTSGEKLKKQFSGNCVCNRCGKSLTTLRRPESHIKFLYNHDVPLKFVRYSGRGFRGKTTVYNIEVEGNHNYFADRFLVSNCHHSLASTSKLVLSKCTSATLKLGLSATPFSEKDSDMLIEESIGDVIHKISYSELIKGGFLLKPTIYFYRLPKLSLNDAYPTIYKKAVVENEFFIKLIDLIVKTLNKMNKSVVVQTDTIRHAKVLHESIEGSTMLTGKDKTERRKDVIQKLKDKEILCCVSTLFEEGIDIPSLSCTINAAGGLSNISTLQRMRSITADKDKNNCSIIDFYHDVVYLKRHSKRRLEIYKSEPEFELIMRDVSEMKLVDIESELKKLRTTKYEDEG